MNLDINSITADPPVLDQIQRDYESLRMAWNGAAALPDRLAVIERWDQLRRRLETWEALTKLHFDQDTRNAEAKAALDYCDELRPKLTELSVGFKRTLVNDPRRAELEQALGKQAFALWEADILTYDPAIEQDLVQEAKLCSEYTALLALAKIEFRGESYNLSSIVKFREHPDREIRYAAEQARWAWFREQRPQLDRIFDDQVRLRHAMARKLGFENYIELGYKLMKRTDYTQADVERFRAEVRSELVPLCVELRRRQQEALGLEQLMFWDESLHDRHGNPAPLGDHDWLLIRAQEMFDELGCGLDDFFRLMTRARLLDLKNREGKAGGGFCTSFPTHGVPFIFANFNGTKGDVEVFTHEMGHAFQAYESRGQKLVDYLWPTYESCEIHSMSLEFLTFGQMEKFFGQEAERFRRIHLAQSLLFIPYGVAVDHFQHEIYARPNATPNERHAMWQEMERMYLPWRNYGDLPHVPEGGFWQFQRHIYMFPFYYIDYTLAQTCALQFWARSRENFREALEAYVGLCRRGGEAPFQELAHSAGLRSPFESGSLSRVISLAQAVLDAEEG